MPLNNFGVRRFSAALDFGVRRFSVALDFGVRRFSVALDFGVRRFSAALDFGVRRFSAALDFGVRRFSAALDRATCNPRSSLSILLLLLPLLLIAAAPPEAVKPAQRQQNMARVNFGMTAVEARKLLGPADHTSRQILYRRYLEQWNYDNPPGLWIELDCVKGQHPRVIGVHLPASEK